MQNVSLQIPDNKYNFFMELVQSLDFVKVDKKESNPLYTAQIQLVEEERRKIKENPASLTDWEIARKQIDWDAC